MSSTFCWILTMLIIIITSLCETRRGFCTRRCYAWRLTLLFVADVLEPLGRVDKGVKVARVSAVGEAEGNRVRVQRGAVHIQDLQYTDTSTVLLRECETWGKNLERIVIVIWLCMLCASQVIAFETRYECSLKDLE